MIGRIKHIYVDIISEEEGFVSGLAFSNESKAGNVDTVFRPFLPKMVAITKAKEDYYNITRYYQFIVFYSYNPGAGWLMKAYDFRDNLDALLDTYEKLKGWDDRFKDKVLSIFMEIKNAPGERASMVRVNTVKT